MNVQGHIIIPLARTGESGLSFNVVGEAMVFAEGETQKTVTVEVLRDGQKIAHRVYTEAVSEHYSFRTSQSNNTTTITITRQSTDAVYNEDYPYIIEVEDVSYNRTIGITCTSNPTYYELVSDADSLKYNAFAGAYSPETVTVQVYRVQGTERTVVPFSGWIDEKGVEESADNRVDFDSVGSYTLTPIGAYEQITWTVHPDENTAATLEKYIYPTSSQMPRIQVWEEVADDFKFCQGRMDEQFIDFVYYNSNSLFQCRTSHTKSSDKTPKGDNSDMYWKAVNKFDNVATQVLLADTAKIDNLYVDDLFMVGNTSAIWMNANHDGMKIVKASDLSGSELSDQTTEQSAKAWANPTAYFHGGSIPDPAEVYDGQSLTGSARLKSADATYVNGQSEVVNVSNQVLVSEDVSGFTLSPSHTVTFEFNEMQFVLTEGESGTGTEDDYSWVNAQVQVLINGEAKNVYGIPIEFDSYATAGTQKSYTVGKFYYPYINATEQSQTFSIRVIFNGRFKGNASFVMSYDVDITASVNADVKYISQYGADGLFIGQSANTYFRAKVSQDDSGEDTSEYQMLASGYGLSINKDGAEQQVSDSAMPLGGLLMAGSIVISGNQLTAHIWTFDGSQIGIDWDATGYYILCLPLDWAYKFGEYYITRSAAHVTLQNKAALFTRVTQGNIDQYWGTLEVEIFDSSNNGVDASFYFSLHYLSDTLQTVSTSTKGTIVFSNLDLKE